MDSRADLSQKHAPYRLGFIVLESTMQAAMAEKQSTVLPSWDTYEAQQWYPQRCNIGTYILLLTNSYVIVCKDHLVGRNSCLIVEL